MNDFPSEKPSEFQKLREDQVLEILLRSPTFIPAKVSMVAEQAAGTDVHCDGLVDVSWRGRTERFAVEVKSKSYPATIENAMLQAERSAEQLGVRPIVVVPYLGEEMLQRLAAREVSGIDLCGNCVILATGFGIWRSGAPNRYRETRAIQNPFSGDSSVFARSFLLQPRFGTLKELREFTQGKSDRRPLETGSTLLMGTASKIVSALEDELIVARTPDGITLVESRRLLLNLRERYKRLPTESLVGKTPFSAAELWTRLNSARLDGRMRAVATGIASAGFYGVLSGVERTSLVVDDITLASELLEIRTGRAFANIELIEDRKDLPYFDARFEAERNWASPIQTWLELAQGGPREQEAGEGLERQILSRLASE